MHSEIDPTSSDVSGKHSAHFKTSISLRKFPYPFCAAATICSDIDDCSRQAFIDIHRILNVELKLPIADSFFGQKSWPWQMAYYENDGQTLTADATFLDQAIDNGLIDSIHTWGDFQEVQPNPKKLRALASKISDRLIENSHKISVWIHHGTLPNYQNIGSRIYPECSGDDPHSPFYTTDYMSKIGVKFCWTGELVNFLLSDQLSAFNPISIRRSAVNALKNIVKQCIGRSTRKRSWMMLQELCVPKQLRDNQRILSFSRFFHHPDGMDTVASRSTFRYCLSPNILNQLTEVQGYLVCYTHLAFPRHWDGDMFADMKVLEDLERDGYLSLYTPSEQSACGYFSKPDLAALKDLARRCQGGKIWVAPTGKLLTYWMVQRYLKWRLEEKDNHFTIHLDQLDDPTTGPRQPEKEELAGLCFYTHAPELTTIRLGDHAIRTLINRPDSTGQSSLSLALPPLPMLDLLH